MPDEAEGGAPMGAPPSASVTGTASQVVIPYSGASDLPSAATPRRDVRYTSRFVTNFAFASMN